ncbi:Efflux pump himE [Fulvia fulva]|nr:Efflux pump himE [Fulvia fulva]
MPVDPNAGCNLDIPLQNCTITTCCLAQGAAFNYVPHFGGNIFYMVFFAVFILPQLWFGIRYRTWGFMIGMILGLVLEVVGYYARVGLHDDPFSSDAFMLYLVGLTIAPVFITAAIYLCLSRIIGLYGQHLSFLKPRTLALTFMASDFLSLVLQAVGGVMAKAATSDLRDPQPGTNAMIAGLLLQAISLGFFAGVWIIFMLRVRSGIPDQTAGKRKVRERAFFPAFMIGLALATVVIEIRSIYRVAELWGGFSGKLWNDEVDFMVLDGVMMAIAVVLLTLFHPGIAFAGQWNSSDWSLRGGDHDDKSPRYGLGPEREMDDLWRRGGREYERT